MSRFGGSSRPAPPPPDDVRGWGREGTGQGGYRPQGGALAPDIPLGPAGGRTDTGRAFSIPSPYEAKPPGGIDFNTQGDGAGFTNANTPAVIPGCAFTLPQASAGVIRSLVLTVNNLVLTSDITWTLRFNGSAVPGWQGLGVTPGPVAYFALSFGPDETYIRVPDGATVDVVFTVNPADAGTYVAGAAFHGWYFGVEFASRYDDAIRI